MNLDTLGPLLNAKELAALFGIKRARFYQMKATGAFAMFTVTPALGPRCYSKHLVARYLAGERLEQPVRVFGRHRR